MVLRLELRERERLGSKVINAIENNLEKIIINKKPEPEVFYRRVKEIIQNNFFSQSNVIRLIKLLPQDYQIQDLLTKLLNYSVTDEKGNNILHVLLMKNRTKDILINELWKLELWDRENKNGVKPIDLLLDKIIKNNEDSYQILKNIISEKSINNSISLKEISKKLVLIFVVNENPKIEELLFEIYKKDRNAIDQKMKETIIGKLYNMKSENLFKWWDLK